MAKKQSFEKWVIFQMTTATRKVLRVPSAVTRANDPFRRFNPEPHQEVRPPIAKAKTLLEELRQRRDMLRSMDPEVAKTVIEVTGKMNFFQALVLAKRVGKLIVPNDVHDRILTETSDKDFLTQFYERTVFTGTLIIYEEPDTPFGEQIVYSWKYFDDFSISFTVPEQFRGKTNCALVIDHPDFEVINLGNNRYEIKLVDEGGSGSDNRPEGGRSPCGSVIHLVENFPKEYLGRYKYNERFRIPIGENKSVKKENNRIRSLCRSKVSYICLVARRYDTLGGRWNTNIFHKPWFDLGVVLF